MHIYIEPKDNYVASEKVVASAIYEQLVKLDRVYNFNLYKFAYGDAVRLLGLEPVQVTLLSQDAFSSYIAQRQAEGADLGHLKPPHINPSDEVLSLLGTPKVEVEAVPAREAERVAGR